MKEETGSFRDPAGRIFYHQNKVFRKLSNRGFEKFEYLYKNEIIQKSIDSNYLIHSKLISDEEKKKINLSVKDNVIEHKSIPYISYPYEWSFTQLKEAALFHLDFNLFLLELDATLIDASAYNVQFIGNKPIFIDTLSIEKYKEGNPWIGHKQFCENFLNPLILKSKKGVKFNNWFKGNLEGIETEELNKLLGFFNKFSYNIFVHVHLLNKLDQKFKSKKSLQPINKKSFFPKKSLISLLNQLRKFIFELNDYKSITVWDDYSSNNSYSIVDEEKKKDIVSDFIKKNKFNLIADIGCNDGVYSYLALKNGCKNIIGFDFDINAINRAFLKSKEENLNFLPLYFDASNPSTNSGWNEKERKSFKERANFDAIIALAFEHHLAIAKNIPLEEVIEWLVSLAPQGLIEFVPKNDPTIKKMLEIKGDIFPDYNDLNFEKFLSEKSNILQKNQTSQSGRIIYEYKR
ncbi:hypothetical protein OA418_03250 [Candidatus Pelagibacter sp.]|nr:hypothetical protein [Candidatus Pelagibacter sp.]